jgi:hypothetical protein
MPNVIAGWVSTEAQVSKYDPLRDYLKKQTRDDFVLTFEEIEDILGFALPRSAQRAEWWDEAPSPQHPREQADAIRDGGYDSRRVPEGGKMRFRKNSVFGYR